MGDDALSVEVVDRPSEGRLVAEAEGHLAELVYQRGDSRLVLVHTEVPAALGGRGIGGSLVTAAVKLAARERLTLVPRCPFARRWLEDRPEATDGVDVDWPAQRA
ncbi:MAG TPA: GNAT family N-acetyltransferase [Acidimicrobiia bacterium]|nr:GNAT family N-acetyltransferase [Acidimicrobiia bacterium]